MLKLVFMTCRYGCNYKGKWCLNGPGLPAAAQSQSYRASLERCAQTNKQESDAHRTLGSCSDNQMSSIARRGRCRA